jgi:hypothetical protein
MKLTEVSNNTAQQFKGEASSVEKLLASIEDGRFTLDGRKLVVHGNLVLTGLGLTSLLGCPQRVHGDFSCADNHLETLEGAPQEVDGNFNCPTNMLKTLKGGPKRVGGNFNCFSNRLKTLAGGPIEVGNTYDCSRNRLISLKGMPHVIKGDFWCTYTTLTSLVGCGQRIEGNLYCGNNKLLTSLEGGPSYVGKSVHLNDCPKLTSLQNIHLHFPEVHNSFVLTHTGLKEHMLGLLLVRGLKHIILNDLKLWAILTKYIGGNILACALELAEAGYVEEAKL